MRTILLAMTVALMGCTGGEACETEGATRCNANAAETCGDGEWSITDDCEADGGTCMQDDTMMEGEAHCM